MKHSLHGQLGALEEFFDRSTRVLTEEDSTFAPKEGMLTVAQQVAHAAQTIEWFASGAFAEGGFDMDFETADKQIKAVTSLKAARAWMKKAVAAAKTAIESHSDADWAQALPPGPIMGGLPRASIFGSMTDHTAHHRGALTVYTRLLGKVPPMPYMDM
jgi:uncharacterized damage-inducible protein DinB